jgi:hypothetical protein
LLSQEEQEALKPKDVKVENPWIYEQTHQEYLDNIKVSGNSIFNLLFKIPNFFLKFRVCQQDMLMLLKSIMMCKRKKHSYTKLKLVLIKTKLPEMPLPFLIKSTRSSTRQTCLASRYSLDMIPGMRTDQLNNG